MKKFGCALAGFIATIAMVFLSCKKDIGPFATKPTSNTVTVMASNNTTTIPYIADADVILAAVQSHNYRIIVVNPVITTYEYGTAQFASATGNFTTLLNADSVWVDTTKLNIPSNFSYISNFGPMYPYSTYTLNFTNPITWKIQGLNSIPSGTYVNTATVDPIYLGNPDGVTHTNNLTLPENWTNYTPSYPRTATKPAALSTYTVNVGHPNKTDSVNFTAALSTYVADSSYNVTPLFFFNLKHFVTGADTVFIVLSDGQGFNYVRKALPTDSLANFSPNDFNGYPSFNLSTYTVQLNLVKYQSQVVSGKKYYLLKIGSYIRYMQIS